MNRICEGRTVIITGAGGGLGRAHALAFGQAGANVMVNDIYQQAADEVVKAIVEAGGQAVTNSCDITNYSDCARVVTQAMDTYGSLDVVLNNAGINRDRMFASMTEDDWDAIMAVHLKGHFCISSHAVAHWRGLAKAGDMPVARIINTTSGAGLQGSVGQSNYAAAKAGICALTLNQAAELARYGITANAVAPAARTAMTTAVSAMAERMAAPADGSFDYWAPDNVSPLMVWLGSTESSHVTGQVFESEGGRISIAEGWHSTKGIDRGERWPAEDIGQAVDTLLASGRPAQKVYGA